MCKAFLWIGVGRIDQKDIHALRLVSILFSVCLITELLPVFPKVYLLLIKPRKYARETLISQNSQLLLHHNIRMYQR